MVEGEKVNIPGFSCVSSFCRADRDGGGACIFVKDHIKAINRQDIVDLSIETVIECAAAEILCVKGQKINIKLVVLTIYRPPEARNVDSFIDRLEIILTQLTIKNFQIIICTDINIDFLKENCPKKTKTVNLLNSFHLRCDLFNQPSRVTKTSSSLLDNIFLSSALYCVDCHILEMGLSDHFGQIANLLLYMENTRRTLKKPKMRNVNVNNIIKFKSLLLNSNFQSMYNIGDVNNKCLNFLCILNKHFEESFPLMERKEKSLKNKNWITREIIVLSQQKRDLHLLKKRFDDESINVKYKLLTNKLSKIIKSAKRKYNMDVINNSEDKMKGMWSVIKNSTGNSISQNSIDELRVEEKLVTDKQKICNSLNSFFVSVAEKMNLNKQTNGLNDVLYNLKKSNKYVENELILEPVTESYIIKIIKSLKNKKSAGVDGISNFVIKQCVNELASHITYLCNEVINAGVFPDRLKVARVIPIFKKGKPSEMSNYRPISLLPWLSKVLERIIFNRLYDHLTKNDILAGNQYGFRPGLNTFDAMYSLMNTVLGALDCKRYVASVCLDLSRAFDCVDHTVLLAKLQYYGIRGKAFQLMKSYLTNRKQTVEIGFDSETFKSKEEVIKCGIPQGSNLGPLLFICFINDLVYNVDQSEIVLFADDATIPVTADTSNALKTRLESAIGQAANWLKNNRLHINIEKTHCIKFKTKNKTDFELNLEINNITVKSTKECKFLGVYIDESLSWSCQCSKVVKSLNRLVYVFLKLKSEIPCEALRSAYFASFESVLRYGLLYWGNSSSLEDVFRVQKRVIRIMDGKPPLYPCHGIFKRQKIMSLPSLFIYEVLIYFQKNIFTWEMLNPIHDHNTRNTLIRKKINNLVLTDQHLKSRGTDFFNKLPDHIKYEIGSTGFKIKLKSYLIDSVFYTVKEFLEL